MSKTLAVAAIALLAGTSAQAQSIAYLSTALDFDGTNFTTRITANYNTNGPANSYERTGTGRYVVTLPLQGNGDGGSVQVNAAVSSDPAGAHYCGSGGWGSIDNFAVKVYISCFDASGSRADSFFSMLYQKRTVAPASGEVAYLWANKPSADLLTPYTPYAARNYNSAGKLNVVTRNGFGEYDVFLPGLKKPGGNVLVSSATSIAARCQVGGLVHHSYGTNVFVYCVGGDGRRADTHFNLSYTNGTTIATGPTFGAYLWANNPQAHNYTPKLAFQFNEGSAMPVTAHRNGTGGYSLEMHHPHTVSDPYGSALVTAYGTSGEYCNPGTYVGDLNASVVCYDAVGTPLNVQYMATVINQK